MEKVGLWIMAGALALGLFLGVSALMALPVMWLWNYLMPTLVGVKMIGFAQAWALATLCALLFKSTTCRSK